MDEALTAEQRLEPYIRALLIKNTELNLTATKTYEAAWPRHVLDGAAMRELGLPAPKLAIDLGSGNGFPGVFIAAEYPQAQVILVERTQKKARAIAELVEAAKLTNAEVQPVDSRELLGLFPQLLEAADLATARAVGPLAKLLTWTRAWLKPTGRALFWKGREIPEDELAAGREAAASLGFGELELTPYDIEGERGGTLVVAPVTGPIPPDLPISSPRPQRKGRPGKGRPGKGRPGKGGPGRGGPGQGGPGRGGPGGGGRSRGGPGQGGRGRGGPGRGPESRGGPGKGRPPKGDGGGGGRGRRGPSKRPSPRG